MRVVIPMVGLACAALASASHAQIWNEHGDAGSLPGTAQITTGVGPLHEIRGTIGGAEDMYCIRVTNVHDFLASTVHGAEFDSQLWLFNAVGRGRAFCDDAASGVFQSTISGQFLHEGGVYMLAITQYNNDALDGDGRLLWNDTPYIGERAPDGPGAANIIRRWTGMPEEPLRAYTIFLRGATFCEVPVPGSLSVLSVAALAGLRRRR
ncbi:MAG: hypothetical protein AABZ53_09615 [Planctomycetota bacterium]